MKTFSCDCGGRVTRQQAKGRFFPFGEYGQVKLTKSCKVFICETCGEYFEGADDHSLQDALRASLQENTVEIINFITKTHKIRENELAFFCSLRPETFSRIKKEDSGKVIPSYAFLLLKGVAIEGRPFMKFLLDTTWSTELESSSSSGDSRTDQGPLAAKAY